MRGIAGDQHAAVGEAPGDQLAPRPRHDRQDVVVEVAADREADGVAHRRFVRRAELAAAADDREAPLVAAVDGDDGRPGALDAEQDEPVARPQFVQRLEIGAAEDHVGGVGKRRVAVHADAGLAAHRAAGAVASHEIARADAELPVGPQVVDLRGHAVGVLHEAGEPVAVVERDGAERPGEAAQHRIEHVLRAALAPLRALRRRAGVVHAGQFIAPDLPAFGEAAGDVDIVLRIVARIGTGLDVGDDAPATAEFHGADADQVLARLVDRAVGLLDHRARHAAPAEIAGERQPDRAGADDQHRRLDIEGCPHGRFLCRSRPSRCAAPYRLVAVRESGCLVAAGRSLSDRPTRNAVIGFLRSRGPSPGARCAPPSRRESICVGSQGGFGCQRRSSLMSVFARIASFRMTATRAIFGFLPASRSRR